MPRITAFVPQGTSLRRLFEECAYFALKPRTFLFFGAISLMATLLRTVRWDLGTPVNIASFFLMSMLLYAIGGLLGVLLLRRTDRQRLPLLALLLWTSIAAIRRIMELLTAGALDAAGVDSSPFPIILAIVSTLVWVTLIAGLQGVNALRRLTSEEVEANIRQLRQLNAKRWTQLEDERTTMALWVRRTVTPTLDQLSAMISSNLIQWKEPGFAARVAEIAERSRELVRQASHSMNRLGGRADALNISGVAVPDESPRHRSALIAREVRVAPVASALVGLTVLGLSAPAIRPVSILAIAVGLPCTFAFLWLLQFVTEPIHQRVGTPRIVAVLVANLIAVLGALFVADSAARWSTAQWFPDATATPFILPLVNPGYVIVLVVAALIVTTGAALIVADAQVWAEAEERLNTTRADLGQLERDMTRQFEQMCAQSTAMLHGPIQGRLATIAMTLRFEESEVSRATVNSCSALLDACQHELVRIGEDPFSEHRTVEEVLEDLRAQWMGLLAVSWKLDPTMKVQLDGSVPQLRNFETLIADLASNASRHGAARQVQLMIAPEKNGIRVVARDDGRGPELPVTMGMGLSDAQTRTSKIVIDADGWCVVTVHLSSF